jgi:RimJ/RimL family protein N-acetyltransferase
VNRIRLERFDLTDIPRLISWLDSAETFWNWTGDWLKIPLTEEQYAPKVTETQGEDPRRLIFTANEPAIRCCTSAGFVDDGPMREDARIRWMTVNIG